MIENWKDDLLKERTLQEVYFVSRKLPKSKVNKTAYSLVSLVTVGIVSRWIYNQDVNSSAEATLELASIGFDLTVQILGFLIGGFAIFATVSDARLMTRLAQAPMEGSDLSVFKSVFFNFLSVFYIYVVTLSVCIIVRVAVALDLPQAQNIIREDCAVLAATIVNCVVFAALAILCAMAVVRLKSFIWNIYQAFLTFLSVSEMMDREETAREAAREND
jgi:hypothetical protein